MKTEKIGKIKFKPKRGQVDYTLARWAPVVHCVVTHGGKILIVKRSPALSLYPGKWSGISGFLDDRKSLEDKAMEELREELGFTAKDIVSIRRGEIFDQETAREKKTWIVHPLLVQVNTGTVRLNWEASDYRWIGLNQISQFDFISGFHMVMEKIMSLFGGETCD